MSTPLLSTKLFIPPLRTHFILRPRLVQKMDDSLWAGCCLILISAPAGFGKTTLVTEWIQHSRQPAAWLTLDEGDNDPVRFWHYVIAALQSAAPGLTTTALAVLQAPDTPPLSVLVTTLINDLVQLNQSLILILDDYHLVENKLIHDSINYLIDHLPGHIRLVITTRADPPFQLARRRGRGEICEIRAADLRFTLAEIVELFNDKMKFNLSSDDIAALENRTEGWTAGLQMAALSMQDMPDKHSFITAFSGDDRHIADYLVEEVLQHQPIHIQNFLLQTSILDRLNASLCDFLTGQHNSQSILNDLERTNLFIIPLDNRREWFRYHPLFAKLLRQNLLISAGQEAVKILYRQVCDWHEQNDFLTEAVGYAFSNQDFEYGLRLMPIAGPWMFIRSELNTLLKWAGLLSDDLLIRRPMLCLMFGWAAIATGHPQYSRRFIRLLEEAVGVRVEALISTENNLLDLSPENLTALAEVGVMEARLALDQFDIPRARLFSQRILPLLSAQRDAEPFLWCSTAILRPPLIFIMALTAQYDGDVGRASHLFRETIELDKDIKNIHIVALAMGHLGENQLLQGLFNQAENTFQDALKIAAQYPHQPSAFFGISHAGAGRLAYERGDLELAEKHFAIGIEMGKLWNSMECLLPACLGLARLHINQGNWDKALALLDELAGAIPERSTLIKPAVEAYRALVYMKKGNLHQIERWAEDFHLVLAKGYSFLLERDALVLLRVLNALGMNEEALLLADVMLASMEKGERWGHIIEVLVQKALLLANTGKRPEAYPPLVRSLLLAEPQGVIRIFIDEGEPLRKLIVSMKEPIEKEHPGLCSYLDRLLAIFSGVPLPVIQPEEKPGSQKLLEEPLSRREIEVLLLIASGSSNTQVAQKLYISINTAKKHITNLFGKLGVATRLQAVQKARDLGIIV